MKFTDGWQHSGKHHAIFIAKYNIVIKSNDILFFLSRSLFLSTSKSNKKFLTHFRIAYRIRSVYILLNLALRKTHGQISNEIRVSGRIERRNSVDRHKHYLRLMFCFVYFFFRFYKWEYTTVLFHFLSFSVSVAVNESQF